MSHSGLLAPFLQYSSGSWTSSLYTHWHCAAAHFACFPTYYGPSPTGSSIGRLMDGCSGIGRVATRVPFAEQYEVHWRSSRHRATRSTKRTYFLVILNRVSPLSTLYRSHIAILQFVPCMSSGKSTLPGRVCVWNICKDVKLLSMFGSSLLLLYS